MVVCSGISDVHLVFGKKVGAVQLKTHSRILVKSVYDRKGMGVKQNVKRVTIVAGEGQLANMRFSQLPQLKQ